MFHFPIPPRPPAQPRTPNFVWGENLFTNDELEKINAYAMTLPPKQVTVGMDLAYRPEMNRSQARWLGPGPDTDWIYARITNVIALLNARHYQFEISGMDEPLYHITYPASELGHYDWHTDVSTDDQPTRKLSITFQMSDPSTYDGGSLEMNADGTVEVCPRERGKLILFPSFQLHRVTPVTRGVRHALVAWIVGPPLR